MTTLNSKNQLYVFLHIPKCAGTTVAHHIAYNFPREEHLPLYLGGKYFDLNRKEYRYFESAGDIRRYLESLSKDQRDKIRIIYGCDVFYGVHKFFDKEARYLCLIRNPIKRLISHYHFDKNLHVNDEIWRHSHYYRNYLTWVREDIEDGGRVRSFTEWALLRPYRQNFINNFMRERGFLTTTDDWDEFYFVGRTESRLDIFFLLYLIGADFLLNDVNQATKHHHISLSAATVTSLNSRNQVDSDLYSEAVSHNRHFRKQHRYVYYVALYSLIKWMLTPRLLVDRALRVGYKISGLIRDRSKVYSDSLDFIKTLLWKESL